MLTHVLRVVGRSCRVMFALLRLSALVGGLAICATTAQAQEIVRCGSSSVQYLPPKSATDGLPNLVVGGGNCWVAPGKVYFYGQVNVLQGGALHFTEENAQTHFYASANGGSLNAGTVDARIGEYGGKLTFHLYGPAPVGLYGLAPQNVHTIGAMCKTEEDDKTGPCGIPKELWDDNGKTVDPKYMHPADRFYQYGPLHNDDRCSNGQIWQGREECRNVSRPIRWKGRIFRR